jgi:hypothetical protein
MHCNTLIQPACHAVGSVIRSVAGSASTDVLTAIAQAILAGVRWIIVNTATWWIQIPSPDLAAEPAVTRMQQWLLPITAAVAVGGVIAAGARMALTRRANPLLDVTGGLLTVAAASTIGVAVTTLLLKAGDAWSAWILQQSTGGQFTQRLELALELGGNAASAVVLVFGILAIILSLVQAALMLFRQAALIILAGVLPLAAAGSIAPMTRPWVRKVTAWMLALICYKPAAAAVYAAAFTMMGSGGSPRTMIMGFVMLVLSVLMLPALMKFFTWTTGSIASSGGGGQLLGAATVGAIAVGAMRSSPNGAGTAAQDQASYLDSRLGPPPPGGASPGPADPPPSGPSSSGDGGPHSGPPSPPGSSAPGAGGHPAGAGAAPTGVATAPSTGAGPAASSAGTASTAATGASAAAGPIVTAAAEGARAANQAAHTAAGAMQPGDQS